MSLKFQQYIDMPRHESGGFDHADVDPVSGRVFVAHTALGQVDILDGPQGSYLGSVPNCPEASGVLYAQEAGLMFAAARSIGEIFSLAVPSGELQRTMTIGVAPNGLAWDGSRQQLLVADVKDNQARLTRPQEGELLATVTLAGRPRWCVYDQPRDRFWVNISDPALVVGLAGDTAELVTTIAIGYKGPHGLAINEATGQLLVACDSGDLVALDPDSGTQTAHVKIAGTPDVIWYNPKHHYLYIAIGKPGVVQVVAVSNMTIVEEISTEEGAHTLTFDQTRQKLYVFLPQSCRVAVYHEI